MRRFETRSGRMAEGEHRQTEEAGGVRKVLRPAGRSSCSVLRSVLQARSRGLHGVSGRRSLSGGRGEACCRIRRFARVSPGGSLASRHPGRGSRFLVISFSIPFSGACRTSAHPLGGSGSPRTGRARRHSGARGTGELPPHGGPLVSGGEKRKKGRGKNGRSDSSDERRGGWASQGDRRGHFDRCSIPGSPRG